MQPRSPNPAPGRTLQSAVAPVAHPILDAFEEICTSTPGSTVKSIKRVVAQSYTSDWTSFPDSESDRRLTIEIAAQVLLSIRLIAWIAEDFNGNTITEAERWFVQDNADSLLLFQHIPWPATDTDILIPGLEEGTDLYTYLPYIFEVFDTGPIAISRASAHERRNNRQLKRKRGVFYTPPDVAGFMVRELIDGKEWSSWHDGPPTFLDPACGTGVLLKSLYEQMANDLKPKRLSDAAEFAARSLFGIDLSPSAVASTSFVLLSACIQSVEQIDVPPFEAWNLIKRNLRVGDSTDLLLYSKTETNKVNANTDSCEEQPNPLLFQSLHGGDNQQINEREVEQDCPKLRMDSWRHLRLENAPDTDSLEAELSTFKGKKFDCVITNPPYSTDERANSSSASMAYLPFVKMMWELTSEEGGTAGIVLPLSIAYNSFPAFRDLRSSMRTVKGTWRAAFFDRAPDSLFGDDVKTRNAILFLEREHNQTSSKSELATTALIRWNSRNRDQLFRTIAFTDVEWPSHERIIPKIGSQFGWRLYHHLYERKSGHIEASWHTVGDATEEETHQDRKVYLGRTAYNWLPVYWSLPSSKGKDVRSDLWSIAAYSMTEAAALYGICASRLSYWLWRVEGDGFHLNKGFVRRIPLSLDDLRADQLERLASVSVGFWQHVAGNVVKSTNKGKTTTSYAPSLTSQEHLELDVCIEDVFELPDGTGEFAHEFAKEVVSAGREVTELTGGTVSHQGK